MTTGKYRTRGEYIGKYRTRGSLQGNIGLGGEYMEI